MTRSSPLIGIGFMVLAMTILPGIDVIAKFLGQQHIPILQIVWARLFFGGLLALPFAARHTGWSGLLPDRPAIHTLRALLLMAATFFFFWALKFLPIADALAVFFVNPLVVTCLSPLILGETVGPRRWAAVAVGFLGTLIIVRPGFGAFNPGSILALASGASLALYLLLTRRISGQQKAIVTTFHTNAIGGLVATVAVAFVWVAPNPLQWLMFLGVASIANLGHYLIVRAYDHAEASLLAPLSYTEMVASTVLGLVFFGDFPDAPTFLGIGILIASAIYISMRERRRLA